MKPIGYTALVERFGLDVMAPAAASYALDRGHRHTTVVNGRREELYRRREDPGEEWTDHLLFALKREGVNLEILTALFRAAPAAELTRWIQSAPTSRYARVAWFVCEWCLGRVLPIEDLTAGNYVDVLDDARHYALPHESAEKSRRHRVVNNCLGTPEYCPTVRRTEALKRYESLALDARALRLIRRYPPELLARATQFLYVKETKSSYAIEHLTTGAKRAARFIALLRDAGRIDCLREADLVKLQNAIVEERYAAKAFRDYQNYVGQSLGPERQVVHFVPPRPEDLNALMKGWMLTCQQAQAAGVHPVILATVSGFGFVFLHPFEDGNGRLHRFLIHHALAAGGFSPPGVIVPVSATMLRQRARYDAALEAYSREVSKHLNYVLDKNGALRVKNETVALYRYPDLTTQAEALFGFIDETIESELRAELEYLAAFDSARKKLRDIVDMPDRKLDMFLKLCIQRKGRLSKAKRQTFAELTDRECQRMEHIVAKAIQKLSTANRSAKGPVHGDP